MEIFDAGKLFISVAGLSNLAHVIREGESITIPADNYQNIKDKIDFICNELERIDLPISLISARSLQNIIHNDVEEKDIENFPRGKLVCFSLNSTGRFKNYSKELLIRVEDELSTKKVMILPSNKERYYNPKEPIWGKEVQDKFLDMIEDITEANNCYALGRNTACVFHLMRVMEKSLQKLADKLGLSITSICDKEWQLIINDIRGKLKTLYPKHADPDRIKYESILGHLETVKIAWRNPTMHPKATYTEEEAKAILNAIEIFMKDLTRIL